MWILKTYPFLLGLSIRIKTKAKPIMANPKVKIIHMWYLVYSVVQLSLTAKMWAFPVPKISLEFVFQ